jgi:hypothetical protein
MVYLALMRRIDNRRSWRYAVRGSGFFAPDDSGFFAPDDKESNLKAQT